ncbi:MAG: metallophosphoesterase [Planctomycetota bacterium]
MQLVWVTDPHLDHTEETVWQTWIESIASHGANGVVITGDISEGDDVVVQLQRLAGSLNLPIYIVLGNHDFYHSSIGKTRQRVIHLTRERANLHYLTDLHSILLDDEGLIALVGEDGWADATEGDYENSTIQLNDFRLIEDFQNEDAAQRKQHLHRLGEESAERLREKLESIPPAAKQVIVATHIPPFCESCWYEGKTTDANWAPFFVCGQVGKLLIEHANRRADQSFTVLCGHTHHDGIARISDNLVVYTGASTYGQPSIEAMIHASADDVRFERQA